jgi:hypothetical protein
MKNLITAMVLMAGLVVAFQSAKAQFTADNLYMGFENQAHGGTKDYIINLGPASGIVGGSSVVPLSSDFSTTNFNSVLGSSSSLFGGVVGGNAAASPTSDLYLTLLRTSNIGNPSVAGSTLSGTATRAQDSEAVNDLSTLNVSLTSGTGVLDTSKTWESDVEPANANSSFFGVIGINPDSAISKTKVLYEDLWYTTSSKQGISGAEPFIYMGYFTLDLTDGTPKLNFTPKNAPASLTPPVIELISKTGNTVTVISSNAVPTYTYQLQYTASLSPTNWANAGSAVTAGTTIVTNSDTGATDTQRFYRVQAQ